MKKREAEHLIGQQVKAWTAMNGEYVGILESIHGSPWRGTVKITGVLRPVCAFEVGRYAPRRGFRPGECIEVGGVNIRPTSENGTSYLHALEIELETIQGYLAHPTHKYSSWLKPTEKALQLLINQEIAIAPKNEEF